MLSVFALLFLLNSAGLVLAQSAGKLAFVQAIWRHGDRAPNKLPYPNDVHTEKDWPRGWAQLTNQGMQELYDLGKFFRSRYGYFIGEKFSLKDLMVVSTDSERAIASAQSMLRGLFPASGEDVWLSGEQWQPIPFFSHTPGTSDPLLRPTDYKCPAYDRICLKQNAGLAEGMNKKYADVFNFLAGVTGFPVVDFHKAGSINNIEREIIHNMSQPSWVYKIWPAHEGQTTLEIVGEMKRIGRLAEFNSREKAKLRGGFLLYDWLSRAINVSSGIQSNPNKMLLYSAHDGTVASLQYALGVDNDLTVPYAACLIMELYRTPQNTFEAELVFRNETFSDRVYTLRVPGCTSRCPVQKLAQLLASQTISTKKSLKKQCKKLYKPDSSESSESKEKKDKN